MITSRITSLRDFHGRDEFLLLMWGFCLLLLVWQRDLGAATLFFILFLALLYLATGDWRYVVGGLFAYFAFDVVALRVDAWWNPWPDADDRAFQIVQSLYALAAGGLMGQGVGQGFPTYIPVVHSDFAFAAIAEEWGLIGSLGVVVCYLVLAHRGMKMAAGVVRPYPPPSPMYLHGRRSPPANGAIQSSASARRYIPGGWDTDGRSLYVPFRGFWGES